MQRFEQMEERMEIVLSSRQIFVLAVLLVGVALVMFVVGFSMGKRSERRRVVLGTPQAAADLLTRLDEMEKESKEFVAKKALTQIRKREIPVEELGTAGKPAVEQQDGKSPESASATTEPRLQPVRTKTQGTIALSRARSMAPAVRTPLAKAPLNKAPLVKNAAPTQGRQVTGSYGRTRRAEPVAARKSETKKAAAQN